ncbi:MAG: restriction endonuclease subunit S [Chitinophagales bacterium]|nr:restriction endonuclease subunit S [Chitinophagales bacterium]
MRFRDFLKIQKDNYVDIDDASSYIIAGVQNYGRGIVNRRQVLGSELTMKKYQVISPNQLMWCKVDTKNGAFGITQLQHKGALASTNMCLAQIDTKLVYPPLLQLIFSIKWYYESINSKSTGTTNRKYLTPKQVFEELHFPDLTIAEQKRIVAKIDFFEKSGFTSEIDSQLTNIQLLRQTILQEAVQGKLVPQNPNDEPAIELLKRIQAEKEQLIKEKKIKKPKPLPPIADDEIPYDLPEGWVWCRLGELTTLITKGSSPKWQGINYVQNGLLFITSENVNSYYIDYSKEKFVEERFNDIEPRSILKYGDYLMNIVGGSIGRTAMYMNHEIANINQAVCLIRIETTNVDKGFLLHFFNSEICKGYMFDKQVDNARPNLSMGNIAKFIIPLPPLKEQQRIVAKVEQLMQLCDELEAQVQQSKTDAEQLLQAVLREAFEGGVRTSPAAKGGTPFEGGIVAAVAAEGEVVYKKKK